jgi:hypothetical protein
VRSFDLAPNSLLLKARLSCSKSKSSKALFVRNTNALQMYNVIEAKHPAGCLAFMLLFFFALTVVISTTGASLEAVACDVESDGNADEADDRFHA